MRLKWILGIIVFIITLFISSQFIPDAIGTICFRKGMRALYGMDMQYISGFWIPKNSRQYRKDHRDAISKFEIARKMDVNKLVSTTMIGFAYNEMKQYENAVKYFKVALKIAPLNKDAGRGLVASLGYLGQYDEAEKVALKRASYLPYREDAYFELAEIYAMKKDFKKAYEFGIRCVHLSDKKRRLVEDRVDRRFLLSHIAFDLGYYEEVIKILDEIQKMEPSNIGVYSGYAESYERLGNKEKAFENWQKVASLDYPPAVRTKANQKIQQLESEFEIRGHNT